jgi:hypothetical protein
MTTMAYPMRVARITKPYRLASRITADCRSIIDQAMRRYGQNEAGIIELAIREYAEKRGIIASPLETNDHDPTTYPEGGTKGQVIHE